MDVVIRPTDEVGVTAARLIADRVRARPDCVLGLATGSSPLPVYAELSRMVRDGELSLARCRAFLLDEYVGLPAGHPEGYRTFIEREFVRRTDIDTAEVHGPDGAAADPQAAGDAYERAIADAGGVDIQILGIGSNGHIGFNEPASSLVSRTRLVALTQQTISDNARFFGDDPAAVPSTCITQGLGTIMEAKVLLLAAFGAGKAEAVAQLVEGGVSAAWPCTIMQMHPEAYVLVDEEAASGLKHADLYKERWNAQS